MFVEKKCKRFQTLTLEVSNLDIILILILLEGRLCYIHMTGVIILILKL